MSGMPASVAGWYRRMPPAFAGLTHRCPGSRISADWQFEGEPAAGHALCGRPIDWRVVALRAQIAAGTYVTDDKLDVVAGRLCAALSADRAR